MAARDVIDLRSDVKTLPSAEMLSAMTVAKLGDDQEGEDPTVRELEQHLAAMLGHEQSLFVPSATMANQIAVMCQVERGEELLAEVDSHILRYEAGGPACLAGAMCTGLHGSAGVFSAADMMGAAQVAASTHRPRTRLVVIENTHNAAGGRVWPLSALDEVYAVAADLGLHVHVDGARLFNASVALGVAPERLVTSARTVSICFSKGLGCPAGAALAGPCEVIEPGRRIRQVLGGAMRQAGVLAAAAGYALRHNIDRLAKDHENANRLAQVLQANGLPVDPGATDTNFVLLDVSRLGLEQAYALSLLCSRDVLWSRGNHPNYLRAVTHLNIQDADIDAAAERTISALRAAKGKAFFPTSQPTASRRHASETEPGGTTQ